MKRSRLNNTTAWTKADKIKAISRVKSLIAGGLSQNKARTAVASEHNMTKAEATQLLLDSGWTLGALNDSVVGTMLNMQNANIPAEEVPAQLLQLQDMD